RGARQRFPTRRCSDLSACCSSDGSANAWPIRSRTTLRSFVVTTAPRKGLAGVEIAHHVQVIDQRTPHLVGHVHDPAAVGALELRSEEHTSELQSRENL